MDFLSFLSVENIFSGLETVFRFTIALEFAMLALAGAAATAHVLAMDAQIRQVAKKDREIFYGLRDVMVSKQAEREKKRQERLAQSKA